jgi:hypothetical protein
MSGLSTIERVSSKMKGPEKLLWYAASAAKAKSTSAASVLLTAALRQYDPPRRSSSRIRLTSSLIRTARSAYSAKVERPSMRSA